MSIDMSQFFQVFFEETEEHLNEMEGLLVHLDMTAPKQEDLNSIFRAVHSIKGGAGTFGFQEMTETAHAFESILDGVRKGTIELTAERIDLFLEGGDILKALLEGYRNGSDVDSKASQDLRDRFKSLAAHPQAVAKPRVSEDYRLSDTPPQAPLMNAGEGKEEEIDGFGFFGEAPPPQDKEAEQKMEGLTSLETSRAPGSEEGRGGGQSRASEKPLSPGRQSADKGASPSSKTKSASIRIEVEKVDQLFNQVGEIVITQAMLSQTAEDLEPMAFEKLKNGLAHLDRNTRNLQESVMSIRMVPIRTVFSRFPRLMRDMQKKFKKEVELITLGEGTEVDKGFVEKLIDPLTHLMRNSFDHGIESPDVRRAAGKDPKGRIILKASHQGGQVVIEVSDDGAGLNRQKILDQAAKRGLPISEQPSDQEVWRMIFLPGFSTADQVSDLSGRGVGMDVVTQNVQSMGGSVEIASEAGRGSRFTVRLPLTLSIIDGMVIRVGREVYVLPLVSIVESIQPRPSEVKSIMGQGDLVDLRGNYIPIARLYKLFNIDSDIGDPSRAVLVVIESEGGRVALMVDELIGQQAVVVKSLEQNFRKVCGIAGATILGDGQVAFIIDVPELVATSSQVAEALA